MTNFFFLVNFFWKYVIIKSISLNIQITHMNKKENQNDKKKFQQTKYLYKQNTKSF